MFVNAPDNRDDSFNNFEVTLNKRRVGKWFAFTSLLVTKNHRWLEPVPQSPNDELFPLDDTWEVSYRVAAGYDLPYGIRGSTLYHSYRGTPGQRTYLFRAADPGGGPSLPSSSSVNIRTEPFGARRGSSQHTVNLRAAKDFRLTARRTLTVDVEAFNAFNANAAYGINYASGPTFGYVTRIAAPRAIRFGVAFEF
jgi:hypothetical protein